MSWKVYALGSHGSAESIATAATPKLESLGYTASFSYISNYAGTFSVTINGVEYSACLNVANTTSYPTYMCVNDDTNEIVIGQTGRDVSGSSQLCYIVVFAILYGVDTTTGESGLIAIAETGTSANNITNWWNKFNNSSDTIYMHRAIFFPYDRYNVRSFVSNLFWGSANLVPGATFSIGTDTFLCLNGCLFAKL